MKICMYSIGSVFNNGTGGVRRFGELHKTLIKEGHDVWLYSADETDKIHALGFNGRCIYQNGVVTEKTMIGLKSALNNQTLFKEIKNSDFDRVVVFDVRAAFSLAVNNVQNIVLFLRQDLHLYKKIQLEDSCTNKFKKFAMLRIADITEAFCLIKSIRIVLQCKFDLDGLIRRHPLLKKLILDRSVVQINNINPSWITENGEDSQKKTYDIAFIGNFRDFRKGHDILLSVLRSMADSGTAVRAAIIGDGKHLERCIKECTGYDNIRFLGRLKNPIPVLQSARLLVVPSYVDSCPNTVMEALYYHVPVIGANRSGIPEILVNSDWLFELDELNLKQKICFYLDEKNNENLASAQMTRRNELLFDWGKKMTDIIIS